MGGPNDGYEVFRSDDGPIVKTVNTFPNTNFLPHGERRDDAHADGTAAHVPRQERHRRPQIAYPGYSFAAHGAATRNGTFLIPSDQTVSRETRPALSCGN